jgi:thiol:disulfide interchange protein
VGDQSFRFAAMPVSRSAARASGKRVLIDFGADWCPDCRVLDQLYTSPSVAPILARDYVLVHIDVGHFDKNMDLSRHYGRAANIGIPALVVLGGDDRMFISTSDGSFADARTKKPSQVAAFLRKWAPV